MTLTRLEVVRAGLLRALMGFFYGLFLLLSRRRLSTSGSRKLLPPVTNPLLTLSATQLARKIRRREVSSVDVVQAYIDRIQEVNPLINAMVKDRFDAALQEAGDADKLIAQEAGGEKVLEDRLPLLGVPLSVKESIALQGMPHTTGLLSRRDVLAADDAPSVALLKRAGAIPLGVTNTSELCMWYESNNYLYGITNNPYDLERIPGGSSGGEGSLLGAAGAVIGMGSDIGGSIRMPCFFNGIFGHKTSPGVVSNDSLYPPFTGRQGEYNSVGPMCRYAEDLVPMLKILAGPNAQMLSLSTDVDLKQLRVFTIPHDGGSVLMSLVNKQLIQIQRKLHTSLASTILPLPRLRLHSKGSTCNSMGPKGHKVVERLEADLGLKVQEVRLPGLKHSFQIWATYMGLPDQEGKHPQPFAEWMGEPGRPARPLWELLKWMLGKPEHTLPAIGMALVEMTHGGKPPSFLLQQKEQLQAEMDSLLGTDGVLLYPTHPNVAPKHHHPLLRPFNFAYTAIMNILGLPATQCPLGLSEEGLPMGVQVVAGKMQDHLPLAMAVYLEKTFGGWRDPGAH